MAISLKELGFNSADNLLSSSRNLMLFGGRGTSSPEHEIINGIPIYTIDISYADGYSVTQQTALMRELRKKSYWEKNLFILLFILHY